MSFRAGFIVKNKENQILVAKSTEWKGKWTLPEAVISSEIVHEAEISLIAKKVIGTELSLIDQVNHGEITNSADFHLETSFLYSDFLFSTENGDISIDTDYYSDAKWIMPDEALELDMPERFKGTLRKYTEK